MLHRAAFLLSLILGCGFARVAHSEAAPSLSFNGVKLGQGWEEFLKAHPKAGVFDGGYNNGNNRSLLTAKQKLDRAAKRSEALLALDLDGAPFSYGLFFFSQRKLIRIQAGADFSLYQLRHISEEANVLSKPLKQVLFDMGAPTGYGISAGADDKREMLLVWERQGQCAYAELSWPRKEGEEAQFFVVLLDRPWSSLKPTPEWPRRWPVLMRPNQDDETRRRWLFALMEQIQPNSTNHIRLLKPTFPRVTFEADGAK